MPIITLFTDYGLAYEAAMMNYCFTGPRQIILQKVNKKVKYKSFEQLGSSESGKARFQSINI